MEKKVIILNDQGLHARPAGILVKAASQFKSAVEIKTDKKAANAKSLMSVMGLGLVKGSEITISATGEDEVTALETLVTLINSKFA
ncbi:MAG: HPr family phosphocarrier protein [Oligoflexia bacterium]|nr:HPr family phosphocarrier protein [Oligoflexia bacterium]